MNYTSYAATALRMLNKYGRNAILRRTIDVASSAEPWKATETPQDQAVMAVIFPDDGETFREDTNVHDSKGIAIVRHQNVDTALTNCVGSTFKFEGGLVTYRVVNSKQLAPDATAQVLVALLLT